MNIIISQMSDLPIYEQIVTQLKKEILNGNLKANDSLPSMRKMAKDLGISVITTKRAYEELERDGFVYSQVGKGTFVAQQNKEMLKEEALNSIEKKIQIVINDSKLIGLSVEEIHAMIDILYREDNL